ncbi:MAG TPA: hypothetical protein VF982_05410 [Anaerolineales bacterium]
MLNEHQVKTLSLERGGRVYKATYFVEHGVLHANLEGEVQYTSCTTNSYDQTRAMLEARILKMTDGHATLEHTRH